MSKLRVHKDGTGLYIVLERNIELRKALHGRGVEMVVTYEHSNLQYNRVRLNIPRVWDILIESYTANGQRPDRLKGLTPDHARVLNVFISKVEVQRRVLL